MRLAWGAERLHRSPAPVPSPKGLHEERLMSEDKRSSAAGKADSGPATEGGQHVPAASDEISELKGRLLRALAEADNARKRAVAVRDEGRVTGLADAVTALIPALDSLELTLKSWTVHGTETIGEAAFEGVAATRSVFLEALKSLGVERIEPTGLPFDPNTAEAMAMREDSSVPQDTVLETVQPGYRLNGRLIRPAFVIVACDQDNKSRKPEANIQ